MDESRDSTHDMTASDLDPIDFRALTPELLAQACRDAMARCDESLAAIVGVPDGERTFANTMYALESALDIVDHAASNYGFMSHVSSDDATRAEARERDRELDRYLVGVRFRDDLYGALRAYAATPEAAQLDSAGARLVEHWLRDYRRHGFELPPEERARVEALFGRLVELGTEFRNAIADWDDGIVITRKELAGLPDSYIEGLEQVDDHGDLRYRVTLDYPQLHPFMANAESVDLRRTLFTKDQSKGGTDNVARLEEALRTRQEIATILGYDSWAAYAVETRMAKRRERVDEFLAGLRTRLETKAATDREGLAEAKRQHVGSGDLNPWDWRFYHNRQLQERFNVDDFAVAEYFPLDACIDGLFKVTESMLGVRYREVLDAPAWHSDVRAFDVLNAGDDAPIARFYMDLHPRPNTYGHAAAFPIRRGRLLADGIYQRPISAIVANFTPPSGDRPSLLRHQEVVTLFHEFGHILHQCLTQSRYLRFSGTDTERDFVEAPSQMFEHWCWDPAILRGFSRHYRTGEPLPESTIGGMIAAKTLNSGVFYTRQLFFAMLDFAFHSPGFDGDTTATLRRLHEVSGFPYVEGTHFQSGFGHLFGYDAGYYGYLWSHVFGDDMFTRFEAAGLLNPGIGSEYRRGILEPGGSIDGDTMVRNFLGRDPNNAAFLRGIGLGNELKGGD